MRGTISLAAFLSEQSEGRKFPLCVSLVSDLFPFPKILLERRGFEARHPRFAAPQIERVPGMRNGCGSGERLSKGPRLRVSLRAKHHGRAELRKTDAIALESITADETVAAVGTGNAEAEQGQCMNNALVAGAVPAGCRRLRPVFRSAPPVSTGFPRGRRSQARRP